MSDQDDLHAYLNNRLAGGTGAIEMAEHCQGAHEGEPLAAFLAELVVEIQEDHRTLGELMSGLAATENRLKQVAARMGEKASHLKLGRRGPRYAADARDPLARHRGQGLHVEVPHAGP